MGSMGPKESIWQGLEWKVVVVVVAIVSIFSVLIYKNLTEKSQLTPAAEEEISDPAEPNPEADKAPASEAAQPAPQLYPMPAAAPIYPNSAMQPTSGQTITAPIQQNPIAPSPSGKTEVRQLPAPTTRVHSLSEAGEVMGMPSSETGAIGVTRTFKLPGSNSDGSTNKVSGEPIVVPPGGQPPETGQSRSYPLPKDPEQP
jgi:hypothetical protein